MGRGVYIRVGAGVGGWSYFQSRAKILIFTLHLVESSPSDKRGLLKKKHSYTHTHTHTEIHVEIPVGPLLSQLHRSSCGRLTPHWLAGPPFRLGLWPCPPPRPSPSRALEGTLAPGTEAGPWFFREKSKARSPKKRGRGGGPGSERLPLTEKNQDQTGADNRDPPCE